MNMFELLNNALAGIERLAYIGKQEEVDALIDAVTYSYLNTQSLTDEECFQVGSRIVSAKQLKAARSKDYHEDNAF